MKPEDLVLLCTMPMPFGKHQGTLIADLPPNYLGWFASVGFPQGQIGQLLELMYELPSRDDVEECIINEDVIDHGSEPLIVVNFR